MCEIEDRLAPTVTKVTSQLTAKKKTFSARDVRDQVVKIDTGYVPQRIVSRLVRKQMLTGGFPAGYIMQICKCGEKAFCVYRFSRYAKQYDFSRLIRS